MRLGSSREAVGFVWQQARPRRGWTSRLVVLGGAISCAAGVGYFANRDIGVPSSVVESARRGNELATTLDPGRGRLPATSSPEPNLTPSTGSAPASIGEPAKQRTAAAVVHGDLERPAPLAPNDRPAVARTSPSSQAEAQSSLETKPARENKGAASLDPLRDADRGSSGEPKRKYSANTPPAEAALSGRPALPALRSEFALPPKVDPRGRAGGYWNGRGFN